MLKRKIGSGAGTRALLRYVFNYSTHTRPGDIKQMTLIANRLIGSVLHYRSSSRIRTTVVAFIAYEFQLSLP